MRSILGTAIFIFILCGPSFAEEIVQVDNQYVQEYKGRLGAWTEVKSQAQLNSLVGKFGTTIQEVREMNGSQLAFGSFLFMPFSDKYLQELEAQGVKRDSVVSRKNDFIWPISRVDNISSAFGMRHGRLHTGTDMPAVRGTPIIAVMDGRVVATGNDAGLGKNILLEHRDNFFTRYAHCYRWLVKTGDYVKKGQIIGLVGSTGRSTGCHLHFEIRYNDIPLNPLDFLPYKQNLSQPHMIRNWK
ncbi:MAG: M23 family metallopeptidase [Spirochaetes bacterium]|nr:M23 family metallopeptidase [Spirochaetota bacterium]